MHAKRHARATAALMAALLTPAAAQAALVNGDFETGDFSGWTTDTDGNGVPSPLSPDFQIVGSGSIGSGSRARLEADFWSTQGDTGSTPQDQVFFANTLSQLLDLSVTPGGSLLLSFEYEFAGEDASLDENIQIGLYDGSDFFDADGNLGFLISETSYGAGAFSATLGSFFNNAGGYEVAFQLNAGFNGFGSYLLVDNVSLTEQTAVPVPATALLMAPFALGLLARRRRNRA